MMPAAKHFDPVIGVDIHIIQPPGPVPPVPVPHPFIGFLFDPFDYAPIFGATVMVNGVPRAIAGTNGRTVPGVHFPIGGTFVKPPANECEMFMGSSTVDFDGDAASYMALPALSCQDIGMVAPFRVNPKKKSKIKSLVLPTSVVLPIPAGPPVLIGGPPTISLMAMGMKLGMSALGKAFKALKGSGLGRRIGESLKKFRQKLFRNMKPGFLKCSILKAEPVNVVTGEVVVEQEDFDLPGRIPLRWTRRYVSGSERNGVCGYGWETPGDARLAFEADGSVIFYNGEPGAAIFPKLPATDQEKVLELVDGAVLSRRAQQLCVRTKDGLEYFFSEPGRFQKESLVTSLRDLSGNSLRYFREDGQLKSVIESAGRKLEFVWQNGRLASIQLRLPEAKTTHPLVSYEYDQHGNLITVRDALNAPYRFEYRNHRMIRHTDRRGLSFYYEYDKYSAGGRCVHAWGDGNLYNYHFSYDDDLRQTEITDSLGHLSRTEYDQDFFVTRETDPLGGVTSYEYDEAGRTSAVTDPAGHRTEYEYDARGNLLKLVQPDGTIIATDYSDDNRAVKITDPNGSEWQQEWDARGLLTKQITPLGAVAAYQYDSLGQLVAFTSPNGATTQLAADAYGNITELVNALGGVTRFSYDALSNLISRTDPSGRTTRHEYDAKSRLVRSVLPSGAQLVFGYDAEDNLTLYQDENGQQTRLEYAGLGEVARRLQPDGYEVKYEYDTEERLIAVINQNGERYELRRDAPGRIVEEIDYWGQSKRYRYDAAGHLRQATDALGRAIDYKTDPLGRVRQKLLPDGSREQFTYDASGNLLEIVNADTKVQREFDAENRLLSERQGTDFLLENVYDPGGNRLERRTTLNAQGWQEQHTIRYDWDQLDQAIAVTIDDGAPIRLQRNASGQIESEQLSPALRRELSYSADGYLAAQRVERDNLPLFDNGYEYDQAGNLTVRRDSEFGIDRYRYNAIGRLIEHLDPQHQLRRFLADPAGNLLRTTVSHQVTESGDEWARTGELAGVHYRFDRAGNLRERREPGRHLKLEWDASQRLVSSHNGETETRYGYDALGRRIWKQTGTKLTRFWWDGDALLGQATIETAPNKQTPEPEVTESHQWVYYPDTFEPLAMMRSVPDDATARGRQKRQSAVFIYHNDPNGCPTRLLDVTGRAVWAAQYSAWGSIARTIANEISNPIRLQGQYEDAETGLHYNRFRYYDSHLAGFISQDPLGLWPSENTYGFAPNILNWIDPLGLKCTSKLRREAVRKAWQEERELIRRTGRGTRAWTAAERKELLKAGKVSGYHGHHINNVKAHPHLAGNPDNIVFLKPGEHLQAHGGNWQNTTTGALLNRTI